MFNRLAKMHNVYIFLATEHIHYNTEYIDVKVKMIGLEVVHGISSATCGPAIPGGSIPGRGPLDAYFPTHAPS